MADEAKRYYPAFLDLENRPVVLIGDGEAVAKKVRQLRRYGADITVITSTPGDALMAAEAEGALSVEHREYVRGDLAGAFLALCIGVDAEVAQAVRSEAESAGCLVNVSGSYADSNFLLPSVVHREPMQIAVSTGGMAPSVAKHARQLLSETFGPEWGAYTRLVAEMRLLAAERITDPQERERVVGALPGEVVLARLRAGDEVSASDALSMARTVVEVEQTAERDAAEAEQAAAAAEAETAEHADDPSESPAEEASE